MMLSQEEQSTFTSLRKHQVHDSYITLTPVPYHIQLQLLDDVRVASLLLSAWSCD